MYRSHEDYTLNLIPGSISRYPFRKLNAKKSEFRLFVLYPRTSSRTEDLRITIFEDVLDGEGGKKVDAFQALSYVWGDASDRRDITVELVLQGITAICKLSITSSLAQALVDYPFRDNHVVLWADGICINQEDHEERAQQVSLMQRIYSEASIVTAWLGPEADNSNIALNLLTRMGESIDVDLITSQMSIKPESPWLNRSSMESGYTMLLLNKDFGIPWDGYEAKSIEALLNRPWFERLWIRQEVLLGDTRTVLLCGRSSITWPDFRKAVFVLAQKRVDDAHPRMENWMKRKHLVSRIWTHRNSSLCALMCDLRDAECSDPRDRVYGILGILPNSSKLIIDKIQPNYSKSVTEVYSDLVIADLVSNHRSDLLTECCTSDPTWSPSWIPNWTERPEIPVEVLENCADGQSAAAATISSDRKILSIKGKFVATITKVWEPLKSPSSIGESLDASRVHTVVAVKECSQRVELNESYPTGEANLEALAISLSGGRSVDHLTGAIRNQYHRTNAQYKTFIEFALEYADDHVAIRRSCEGPAGHNGTIGTASAILRDSMITTKEGYFGFSPVTALPGDRICVILGCMSPMIIRPSDNYFTVVGPCSIHGFNWGEALLGPFPNNTTFIWNLSGPHGGAGPAFVDRITGEETLVDPRIDWELLKVKNREDAFVFRQMLDGSGTDYFRRPDAEYFKTKGIELDEIHLK